MTPSPCYLARYGRTNRMEWFDCADEVSGSLERGRAVVVQSRRGEELAEVLLISNSRQPAEPLDSSQSAQSRPSPSQILRAASAEDLEAAQFAERLRDQRFDACLSLLEDGRWPVELVDVEILLDGHSTVAYVVRDDDFDLTALRSQFRAWFDFETFLEPADFGHEAAILIPADLTSSAGASAGGCGSGGCGCSSGGGCGVGK